MRIGGLASGIDTESIINDLMKANRIPLNKITQKKQYAEWQVANYRSTNLELKKMSDSLFKNQILSNNFNAKNIDVSNPNAIGIKNKNSTGDFSGSLTVGQLAENATLEGQIVEGLNGAKMTTTLGELLSGTPDGSIIVSAIDENGVMQDTEVKYKSTDTLQSLINNINKNTGVTAFVDPGNGKIGVTAKTSGETTGSPIVITGGIAGDLGLTGGTIKQGKDAILTFNGMSMKQSSNTFEINGFEFTLKETTTSPVTFSSSPDTDKIVDTVKQFVDDYNKLIETLNDKIREPKYRDFHPLSAEEKADMKEKEIELWEEKAMSGTLRNDPIISSMLSQMRTALMGSVGGDDEQTLSSIGINFSKSFSDNGKLEIDEDVLRREINADPDRVHKLFSADGGDKLEDKGFAQRLRGIVQATEKKIEKQAGTTNSTNENFTIGKGLIDMDKQIARFEDRLQMTESRLWKQFQAMEIAIQRANSQSASLMNSFGGM